MLTPVAQKKILHGVKRVWLCREGAGEGRTYQTEAAYAGHGDPDHLCPRSEYLSPDMPSGHKGQKGQNGQNGKHAGIS